VEVGLNLMQALAEGAVGVGPPLHRVVTVSYQPSGSLASYTTGPGIRRNVVTTISQDPSGIPRPSQVKAQPVGSIVLFDTGTFAYDGAGNITAMGSDSFTYDARSRLCKGILSGPGTQFYTYDRFGNMVTKGFTDPGTCWSSTSWSTNRVPTATYAGNPGRRGDLTSYAGASYSYDSLDRMTSTGGWSYLFDGTSERTVRVPSTGAWTYTFRDEGKRLSTEFADTAPVPSRDNIFLGSLLVASYANPNVNGNGPIWAFYSSDHLGTPRLITDVVGNQSETRHNWPYGEDIGTPSASERVRFASMERDTESTTYHDHARHHEFTLGRFLSPDKLQGRISNPQSWNRYAYALNNPLKFLDPDGQAAVGFIGLGNSPGGITKIVSQINGAPGVGQAISIGSPLGPTRKDIARAVSFLASRHRANPNEATVVIGHSLGAAAAIETAKQLGKQGVTVDLVITIDPVFSNKTVSSNVTEAQNYYETRDPNPVIRGKMLTAESPNTALSNTEVLGVNRHTDIDDVVADTGAAATQVREVGMRYVSAPTCGDPNFVGPCAR
jgi:RHS repeat-associated protein